MYLPDRVTSLSITALSNASKLDFVSKMLITTGSMISTSLTGVVSATASARRVSPRTICRCHQPIGRSDPRYKHTSQSRLLLGKLVEASIPSNLAPCRITLEKTRVKVQRMRRSSEYPWTIQCRNPASMLELSILEMPVMAKSRTLPCCLVGAFKV